MCRKILECSRNITVETEGITKIAENIYMVDGVENSTGNEVNYIVQDCSNEGFTFNHVEYLEKLEDNYGYSPVMIFKDWKHDRKVLSEKLEEVKTAKERNKIRAIFKQKIAIYTNRENFIELTIEKQGINYLEYSTSQNGNMRLEGHIYNLTFKELEKLFNVTGIQLFKNNVRYGLEKSTVKDTLRLRFKEYILKGIYEQVVASDLKESEKDLVNDMLLSLVAAEGFGKMLEPENFWFYHNGISIFSFDKIDIDANKIRINTESVSVINGAQTITNLFEIFEFFEYGILKDIKKMVVDGVISNLDIDLDKIMKSMYVKTIFIEGEPSLVGPVTYGLNTQIPIQTETIIADSEDVKEINKKFAGKINILKDGEVNYRGINMKPLEFIKAWLIIKEEPGKSKNFSKTVLEGTLRKVYKELDNRPQMVDKTSLKIKLIEDIYSWWERDKKERRNNARDKSEMNINSYGKNYFASFALREIDEELGITSDEEMVTIYELFVAKIKGLKQGQLELNDFKKDELANELFKTEMREVILEDNVTFKFDEEVRKELIDLLNIENQSSYTYAKTINNYFDTSKYTIKNFRIVSFENLKLKEAFPLPNSTFGELINEDKGGDMDQYIYNNYSDSKLSYEVEKQYPLFVIFKSKNDEGNPAYIVQDIQIIEKFTLKGYAKGAERAYEKTVTAFEEGDELLFPKTSEHIGFHVRPKAKNAEDSFEFTNGEYITKRTFWANKSTIEAIVQEHLGDTYMIRKSEN